MNKCKWTIDDDGVYIPECDNGRGDSMFLFDNDGPIENGFKFCPYCGKPLDAEPAK